MSDAFAPKSMKRKNLKGLALSAPPPRAATPSSGDAQIPGSHANDDRADTLEIGVEFQLDLRAEDLIVLKELGAGNGGTVSKVQHAATKVIMARKIIHVEAKKEVRKRIVRELKIMHECNSPYIVSFYGAFMNETGDVIMCMEYADCGSLDAVSRNFGPVRVDVLGKIAEAVLGGLTYLYKTHRIMHRDLKPSNVLVNSKGQIKLCDFGVSSELEGSVADTFVGTGTYMAPERIQGAQYTIKSDVWSFGLTIMELAIGKFPFSSDSSDEAGGPQGILDLLSQIVLEDAPRLPKSDAFPLILEQIVDKCLIKDPNLRPTPEELYETDPFIQAAKRTPVDLAAWAVSMMVHHNRKSHLILPQDSPSANELPRINNGSSSASSQAHTPTFDTMDQQMGGLRIAQESQQMGGLRNGQDSQQMSGPRIGQESRDSRPYPARTSSATSTNTSRSQPQPQQPSYSRAPPSGPIPHLPRKNEGYQF